MHSRECNNKVLGKSTIKKGSSFVPYIFCKTLQLIDYFDFSRLCLRSDAVRWEFFRSFLARPDLMEQSVRDSSNT